MSQTFSHHKVLVVYQYYEKDATYIENFLHFLAFGYSPLVDYVVVIAGGCSIELPQLPNLRYVHTENRNQEFGGFSYALKNVIDVNAYEHFIFVNSSVRGPYVPPYSKPFWAEYFLDKLVGSVGLAGSTINIMPLHFSLSNAYRHKYGGREPFPHIQTMIYAMPKAVLSHLLTTGFYDIEGELDKGQIIRDYEVRLSQAVLEGGWNMECLLPEYGGIDFRVPQVEVNPTAIFGDPSWPSAYFGRTAHPYETIFIKTHRNMFTPAYLDRLSYSALKARSIAPQLLASPAIASYLQTLQMKVANSKETAPYSPS